MTPNDERPPANDCMRRALSGASHERDPETIARLADAMAGLTADDLYVMLQGRVRLDLQADGEIDGALHELFCFWCGFVGLLVDIVPGLRDAAKNNDSDPTDCLLDAMSVAEAAFRVEEI